MTSTKQEAERALLEAAIDEAYPVADTPHTSVRVRNIEDRHAFKRGCQAARATPSEPAPASDTPSGAVWTGTHTYPSAQQAGDALAGKKGCRDAFNLISNCRKLMAEKQMDKAANWVIACELFAVGSTTAMAICREADIDPMAYTMGKLAAMAASAKEGGE